MRLNPYPKRFSVKFSGVFEAAVDRIRKSYPNATAVLEEIEFTLANDPEVRGTVCDGFDLREADVRYYVTARTRRLPTFRVLYEIEWERKRTVAWHIAERSDIPPLEDGVSNIIPLIRQKPSPKS